MKKMNLLKSALSVVMASVMLGTAFLPASADDSLPSVPDVYTIMKSSNYYYFSEDEYQYHLGVCVDNDEFKKVCAELIEEGYSDPFEYDVTDMYCAALPRMQTYRFEDCPYSLTFRVAAGWAMGYFTDEERDNYIQTALEGGSLPEDAIALMTSLKFDDDWLELSNQQELINEGKIEAPGDVFPHTFDDTYYLVEDYRAQYASLPNRWYQMLNIQKEEVASAIDGSYQSPAAELLAYVLSGSGDINSNSEADLTDAVLLARAIGGTYELSAASRREADLNGDLTVDQNDLNALLRVLAGA